MENTSEFERKHPVLAVLAVVLVPEFAWFLLILLFAGLLRVVQAGYVSYLIYGFTVIILLVGIVLPAVLAVIYWRKTPDR